MDEKNIHAVEIYNEIAEDYAKNYDSEEDDGEGLVFLKTFLSYLKPNSYIVDIGCGTGFSAGWFSKKGFQVEGSDLSTKMIEIARVKRPHIQFSVADMRIFQPTKNADAVWAGYSMFHFEQTGFEQTIENIKTYLKSGGIFGLVMQEGDREVEVPEPFLPGKNIYIHLYTQRELTNILEKYGFEILDFKRKPAQYPNEFPYNKILIIGRLK